MPDGSQHQLHYLTISNREALQSIYIESLLQVNINETDLISGVYEGGLKIWDCSIDLVNYIAENPNICHSKSVIELGCGQGLPGLLCLTNFNAQYVVFQDYNKDVLDNATKKVIEMNSQVDLSLLQQKYQLLAGSWETLCKQRQDFQGKFDLILMSETLYNINYYDQLVQFIDLCLSNEPNSMVLIGTKTFYFGLGGGYFEFQKYLDTNWKGKFRLEVVKKLNDMKSIERLILIMKRQTEIEMISQDLASNTLEEQIEKSDFMLSF
ncbi:UNKNOWN [Stylonychia lemnae]|uniref:protein-histidine N-methyltransferase n=1 Tax=Stylonychia lemnae TaxID=5949 RepID=A0A078ANF3_STYLE|nr:UNKNOWN [Stylonychia lemnae]|eukprot:CDW82488.1 UNKNOWN [Stylonychia lemnae]